MKALKYILYTCLFFLIGELIIRIDLKYDLLNKSPNKIEVKIEESELRNKIEQGNFIPNSNQIRILVIGDSYINGGGISTDNKFSKNLSYLLEKDILILDISRPSNSTLDNYNSFMFYQEKFKPQFVFWAYNFNDILYSIPQINPSKKRNTVKLPPKRVTKKRIGLKKYVSQLYSFSELIRYMSSNTQKQLKFRGVVLPIGEFYQLTQKTYLETNKNWIDTKKKLDSVSQICKRNQSKFILYRMPEFNLLNHPQLFSIFDKEMVDYVDSNRNITYFNGIEDFNNEDGDKFMLSKYDGHPNELAHMRIAKKIAEYINRKEAGAHNNE
jgi:lysophospholipase L1-like esterase